MSAYAFSTVLVCMFLFFALKPLDCVHTQEKRSDGGFHGLLSGILKLMVDEREERTKLRNEVAAVKDKLVVVLHELNKTSAIKAEMDDRFENISQSIELQKQVSMKQAEDIKDFRKEQKDTNKKIRNDVKTLKDGYRQLLSNTSLVIEDLKEQINNRKAQVAFTARIDGSTRFETNAVIKFGHVISNIGGGYNKSDGIFYCPVDGVYVFDISITGDGIAYVDAWLVKNGNSIDYFYSRITGNNFPTATASITLNLKVGDRVWLKCNYRNRKYYQYSFFTGYLIV